MYSIYRDILLQNIHVQCIQQWIAKLQVAYNQWNIADYLNISILSSVLLEERSVKMIHGFEVWQIWLQGPRNINQDFVKQQNMNKM